ncbi:hypothetical protein LCGC14_0349870 [marine sediment metagenome]|uniref:Uncharacterized protein n=1 Tax=marine sediment metagenome TaxID=412755 RepID=A0A0F9TB48_9ZZZZ
MGDDDGFCLKCGGERLCPVCDRPFTLTEAKEFERRCPNCKAVNTFHSYIKGDLCSGGHHSIPDCGEVHPLKNVTGSYHYYEEDRCGLCGHVFQYS